MDTENFSTLINTMEQYRNSEKIALICGDKKLTYKQLIADSKYIAQALVSEGIKKGDRILFCMKRTVNAICALLGIIYAGGVYVAADTEWPKDRLDFVSKDAQTVFSMTDENYKILLEKDFISTELPIVNGEDEVAVYYTSGTTGQPKGTVLHHAVLGSQIMFNPVYQEKWKIYINISKLAFVASMLDMCVSLFKGKTFVLATSDEQHSIELLSASMKRNNADAMNITPSVLLRFLENASFAEAFNKLNFLVLGGEKLLPVVIEKISKLTNAVIAIGYGSSEMGHCTEYRYMNDGKVHLGANGYGVKLYVLNEDMEETARGNDGELFIGGTPAKYGHYLNRPDLDAEKYVEHHRFGRLFKTGDLAFLEDDGQISIIGRADSMVKLHGQRIEIAEIENATENFAGIKRAAVKLTGEAPHEMLAAYYSVSEEIQESELRRHLADKLPYYMVPSVFMRLDKMPENANGKLDYRALPPIKMPEQRYIAPETDKEKLLCKIFGEILQVKNPISVNDSFFALGGDSISAMLVISRLQKFGYYFEIRWLFAMPSVRQAAPLMIPIKEKESSESVMLPEILQNQHEAVNKNIGYDKVECVYPVTRAVSEKLENNDPYFMYFLFEVDALAITPDAMKQRISELIVKHQALRSVFSVSDNKEHIQVVLREHDPDYFSVNLAKLSEGDELSLKQKAYLRTLLELDLKRPKNLNKDVLFRVGLIRISKKKSILFIACSHLLLDGIGATIIIRELTDHKIDVHNDKKLWYKRILRLYNTKNAIYSLNYWKELLNGCKGFTRFPMKETSKRSIIPKIFYSASGKKLYEQILKYCVSHKITIAALIHFVFGKMLMELSQSDDVCFISIGSGRTADDAYLPGMFFVNFPVRLKRGNSLVDCQMQLISSQEYMNLLAVEEPEFMSDWKKCYAVLDVVNLFADNGQKLKKINTFELAETPEQNKKFIENFISENIEEFSWRFLIDTDEQLGFICAGSYNAACYDSAYMEKISQNFLRQLRMIINGD